MIREEGWGEFYIVVDIVCRNDSRLKITHYLKLDGAGSIISNETFDTITIPHECSRRKIPLRDTGENIPLPSELGDENVASEYDMVESGFLERNKHLLHLRKDRIRSLMMTGLLKEEELLTVLNSRKRMRK